MATESVVLQISENGARAVSRNISEIGTAASGAQSPLNALKQALSFAGAGISLGLIVGRLSDFSGALYRAGIAAGVTSEGMKSLGERIAAVGAETGTGFVDAAKSFELLAKSGLNAADATDVLKSALTLASATGTEAVAATGLLARVLSAYGLGAKEAGRVTDQLAISATHSVGGLEEIGSLLIHIAPAAKSAGLSLTETEAAVQVLARSGLNAREAISQLRELFVALENPTESERILLLNTGVSIDKAKISSVGLAASLSELGKSGSKLEGLIRGGRALDIFKQSTLDVKTLQKELENAEGTAQKMATTFDKSLSGSLQQLTSAFDKLLNAAVGEGGLRNVVDLFTKSVNFLAEEVAEARSILGLREKVSDHTGNIPSLVPNLLDSSKSVLAGGGGSAGQLSTIFDTQQAKLQNDIRAGLGGGGGPNIIPAGTEIPEFQKLSEAIKSTTASLEALKGAEESVSEEQKRAQLSAASLSEARRNLLTTQNALDQAFINGTINAVEYAQGLEEAQAAAGGTALENLELTQSRLNEQFKEGLISLNAYNQGMEEAQVKAGAARTSLEALHAIFPELDKDVAKTADTLNTVLIGGLNRAIDAFAEFASTGFKSFEDFKKVLADILLDVGKQILALIIKLILLKTIEAAFGTSTGTTGGLLTTLLGGTATQMGGPVGAGVPIFVGERGPELFVPPSAGNVVPNNQIGGRGQPNNTTVNVLFDPDQIATQVLGSRVGETILVNAIQKNKHVIRQIVNS